MVRYLFHVMSDHTPYKGEAGRSFSDFKIATANATVIARELAIEGEDYVGFSVCVTDDQGNEVARVPIARDTATPTIATRTNRRSPRHITVSDTVDRTQGIANQATALLAALQEPPARL